MTSKQTIKENMSIILMLPLCIWVSMKSIEILSTSSTESQVAILIYFLFAIGLTYRIKQFIDRIGTL